MSAFDDYAAEWRAADPKTPEEIRAFYEGSKATADDLAEWHSKEYRQQFTEIVLNVVGQLEPPSILDFGCGRGDDLKAIRGMNAKAKLRAIEPNASLWGAPAEYSRSLDELRADEEFQLVLLIDVLEHLPDPEGTLKRLMERVPIGGVIVEHTPVWDIINPSHLVSNWGWQPDHLLVLGGFKLIEKSHGGLKIWQRTALARQPGKSLLLNVYAGVELTFVDAAEKLQQAGWSWWRKGRDALITRSRSMLVSNWWRESGDDVFLMVDNDIIFRPEDAEKIVERTRECKGVIGATYPWRGATGMAVRLCDGFTDFKKDAVPVPCDYLATGFMCVHRDVIDAMVKALPICSPQDKNMAYWPMFQTLIVDHQELSEDWAFTYRARKLGFPTLIDPSIRLGHIGQKIYRLEDYALREEPDVVAEHIRVEELPGSMPRMREVWSQRPVYPLVATG